MIPFEREASLTESERYVKSVLERKWEHVIKASPGRKEDLKGRFPEASERVSRRIREDTEEASEIFRPGVPDLFAFNSDGEYLFVEVKTDGDGLRHSQLKWLSDFKGANMEIWFSEHEKDYEKLQEQDLNAFSLKDKDRETGQKIEKDRGLKAPIPEDLAAVTGLEEGSRFKWRFKSKDELILDLR